METEQTTPAIPTPLLILSILVLIGYSLSSLIVGFHLSALVSAALALPVALHLPWLARHAPAAGHWSLRAASLLLFVVAVGTFTGHMQPLTFWSFLVPLLLFAVWPLWIALAGSALFIVAVLMLATDPALGMLRHQLVPMLILSTALTAIFVYLREYKAAQLAPLRRTDSLTLASTRDYLETDLYREIQRGEREGTPVTVVALQVDEPETSLPKADRTNLIVRMGRLLHRTLRDFDSYYRIEEMTFFLVLPVTDTPAAIQTGESLCEQAHRMLSGEGLALTVSAGVAGMNVADDTTALENKALEALRRARKQGGNRVIAHTESGGGRD